jgi:hypothetical protein
VTAIAFATFRFTIVANFVAYSTGRSARFRAANDDGDAPAQSGCTLAVHQNPLADAWQLMRTSLFSAVAVPHMAGTGSPA